MRDPNRGMIEEEEEGESLASPPPPTPDTSIGA